MRLIHTPSLLLSMVVLLLASSGCSHLPQSLYESAVAYERESAGLQPASVTASQFEVALLKNDWQPGRSQLVMVHGFGANKDSWVRMTQELSDRYNILLLDLPGHGDSSALMDRPYDLMSQRDYLAAILESMDMEPAVIIGNSMGGAIATTFAAAYPERTRAVILFNPAGIHEIDSEFSRRLEAEGHNPLIPSTPEEFDAVIEFVMEEPPWIPWPIDTVLAEDAIKRKPMREKIFADLVAAPNQVDFKALLPEVRAPALIVWGRQDRVIHVDNSQAYLSLMPVAELALFEDLGHVPMIEDPERSAEVVDRFLSKHLGESKLTPEG